MSSASDLAGDLMRTLIGEKDGISMDKLKSDMRICADHYRCTREECAQMWGAALGDLASAAECFDRTARLVLGPLYGVDDRIKASVEAERAQAGDNACEWRT